MNIAHVLAYTATFPLKTHHGRFDWVLRLAGMQAAAGHTVTVYCGPSHAENYPGLHFRTLKTPQTDRQSNNKALFELALSDTSHEVYHSHLDWLHYSVAGQTARPIVYTQHWFPTERVAEAAHDCPSHNVTAVPVTTYMLQKDRELAITCSSVIPHGIDLALYTPNFEPHTESLLFVGRISPHKGVREAIEFCKTNNQKLRIVGKLAKTDAAYWAALLPEVDGEQIQYLGPKTRTETAQLMATASALLFMPQSYEAFGQTFIEAQACGTPIITNQIGAANELFLANETGFVVNDNPQEMLASVFAADPRTCRQFAAAYDQNTMVAAYTGLYAALTGQKAANAPVRPAYIPDKS